MLNLLGWIAVNERKMERDSSAAGRDAPDLQTGNGETLKPFVIAARADETAKIPTITAANGNNLFKTGLDWICLA